MLVTNIIKVFATGKHNDKLYTKPDNLYADEVFRLKLVGKAGYNDKGEIVMMNNGEEIKLLSGKGGLSESEMKEIVDKCKEAEFIGYYIADDKLIHVKRVIPKG